MVRLFIRHPVESFEKWWEGYSAGDDFRAAGGVKAAGVHRAVDDPNDLTVWHDFETPEEARAFADNPELHDAMDRTGVRAKPIIWITQTV